MRSVLRVWEKLSLYLPVLLMALVALATYWLVRSTPIFAPAPGARPLEHVVDYTMRSFAVRSFDEQGHLKSEIFGEQARHFPDTDTIEIDGVHIRSFDTQRLLTVATSDHGVTNADGSEVQLSGHAVVVRDAAQDSQGQRFPRLEFRGEFLHAFLKTERLQSHLPVELLRDEDRFTADRMSFDGADHAMHLSGHVRGVVMPRPVTVPH